MPKKTFKEKYLYHPNRYIVGLILILSITSFFFLDVSAFQGKQNGESDQILDAKVLQIISERDVAEEDIAFATTTRVQELLTEVWMGGEAKHVRITNNFSPLKAGDKIYVQTSSFEGPDEYYSIVSAKRDQGLFLLAIFFFLLVVATSGKKGINAFIGLIFSFSVIFTFIVPRILSGENPVTVSLIGSVLILLGTLYVSYGFNRKSVSALIGISVTLLFVGLLSNFLIYSMNFTGASSEEASLLAVALKNTINLAGLLIAGIIIAAIGVLDDITITQASVVSELIGTDPTLDKAQLFKKAMTLGRDHISAVVNTLVLAYTGASLPLVLLFFMNNDPMGYLVSNDLIAEEIIRTLVASSGLVIAVPITTLVAVTLFKRKGVKLGLSPLHTSHIGHHG